MTCQYPEHNGDKKRARGRAEVNLKMDQDIWKLFEVVFPIECVRSGHAGGGKQ